MHVNVKFRDYSNAFIDCDNNIFMELRNYFTFDVDGARFNPKFKYGTWDGKIRMLSNEGLLPIGLVDTLVRYCKENDLEVNVDSEFTPETEMTREEFDTWLSELDIYSGQNKITPHWYQADTVFNAINKNRMIGNLPTSAGKSLIACLLTYWYLQRYEGKVLVLVPTTALVDQMIGDFADYRLIPRNACLGVMAGTRKNGSEPIVVSTWQSACKMNSEWFKQFGMIIVDECHLSTAKELTTIIKGMADCRFKIGMSGSLRDGKANVLQYIGMFGDVFRPVTTKKLMEDGQVTDLDINAVFLRYPDHETILHKGKAYADEIKVINNHTKRNAWICRLALKLAKERNENVLIMFKHVAHGKWLYEALKKKYGEKVHFVSGETKTDDRVKLKGDAENEDGLIIVASLGVFSTGISIKKLHHVIFSAPTKSKILVLQSIGRVLRKHSSKDVATLWDIIDDICVKPKSSNSKKKYVHKNYAYNHGLERIQRYSSENFNYRIKEVALETV
ncbi:UvsW RNA-DNA and DNA-DNA helicase/ATPase [Aeromonas phage Aeh1]|uniref:UvsW RNA-DNA and DNA-DNA helicase/ATPase n=1 Tax=Aeromonas phage Aeh1 TaxID=2880362 RepID=Q76YJ3_9CAUD|nr:DNA helicase [Aeromonas phage Aeh1]AAQ17902.1 UvsW RNA-DNA and DNA-DNA helicase/ATPase [Aeromonas phage Aeh1]